MVLGNHGTNCQKAKRMPTVSDSLNKEGKVPRAISSKETTAFIIPLITNRFSAIGGVMTATAKFRCSTALSQTGSPTSWNKLVKQATDLTHSLGSTNRTLALPALVSSFGGNTPRLKSFHPGYEILQQANICNLCPDVNETSLVRPSASLGNAFFRNHGLEPMSYRIIYGCSHTAAG